MGVQLVTLSSNLAEFSMPASTQVWGLRLRVAKEVGLPLESQRLVLGDKVLDASSQVLGDFGSELVVTVLRRPRLQALSATASSLLLWDLESRSFSSRLGEGLEPASCVDMSEQRALSSHGAHIMSWDLGRQRCTGTFSHCSQVTCFTVHWANAKVLSGTRDGQLFLWDLLSLEALSSAFAEAPLRCLAADWSARKAVSCGSKLSLWSLDNLSKVQDFDTGVPDPVALFLDWPRCVVAGQGLRLWNLASGTGEPFRCEAVLCAAVSWDADRLVTGGADGTLRLWSLSTRRIAAKRR
ncbi:unnamed protein product [Effrenium voratum]|nr:unnamed protein product [Effrenium voratum]